MFKVGEKVVFSETNRSYTTRKPAKEFKEYGPYVLVKGTYIYVNHPSNREKFKLLKNVKPSDRPQIENRKVEIKNNLTHLLNEMEQMKKTMKVIQKEVNELIQELE